MIRRVTSHGLDHVAELAFGDRRKLGAAERFTDRSKQRHAKVSLSRVGRGTGGIEMGGTAGGIDTTADGSSPMSVNL